MQKPIGLEPVELNDAELAAVAGGSFTVQNSANSVNNSFNPAQNSLNNSFNGA